MQDFFGLFPLTRHAQVAVPLPVIVVNGPLTWRQRLLFHPNNDSTHRQGRKKTTETTRDFEPKLDAENIISSNVSIYVQIFLFYLFSGTYIYRFPVFVFMVGGDKALGHFPSTTATLFDKNFLHHSLLPPNRQRTSKPFESLSGDAH